MVTQYRIDFSRQLPLHSIAQTRMIEQRFAATLAPHTLMQRAGLAVAKLARALEPHAHTVWLACGPGNNGGDGLEAAMHLRMQGLQAVVTWLGTPERAPADARASYVRAREAGVIFLTEPPPVWDLAVDALLGIGGRRAPEGVMLAWLERMHAAAAPVLCVDIPSGLNADTGAEATLNSIASVLENSSAHRRFRAEKRGKISTLSLLTLKPGLFMAQGRDACGELWFDDLGLLSSQEAVPEACAILNGQEQMRAVLPARRHDSHKGSYGDLAVIGGASGMQGAAILAARTALHAGAGRVFVGLLGGGVAVDVLQAELMFRDVDALNLQAMTVVCGCGGADAVRHVLPRVLAQAPRLVLDADALNAIAADSALQTLLKARQSRGQSTILTPHPLEAARLLGLATAQVQADRLQAARSMAERYQCTVLLKGSGSIIASPGQTPSINPTGDARLATAGTGDVLAGIGGAILAQQHWPDPHAAASYACWEQGLLPDRLAAINATPMRSFIQSASELIGGMSIR